MVEGRFERSDELLNNSSDLFSLECLLDRGIPDYRSRVGVLRFFS